MVEFEEWLNPRSLMILPIGAVEEHGPHLPLNTDSVQPEHISELLVEALKGKMDVLIAPPLRYGYCNTTAPFPGTISISVDSLKAIVKDILSEFSRQKIPNVLVLSGHAGSGHLAALRMAAGEVAKDTDMLMMVLSDYEIVYALDNVPDGDGHAGFMETSRVLAIRPDLVKPERPVAHPKMPQFMILSNPEEHFKEGMRGDTTNASAEAGQGYNDQIVEKLVELIEENFL